VADRNELQWRAGSNPANHKGRKSAPFLRQTQKTASPNFCTPEFCSGFRCYFTKLQGQKIRSIFALRNFIISQTIKKSREIYPRPFEQKNRELVMMPTVFIICLELQHIMLKAVRRSIPGPKSATSF